MNGHTSNRQICSVLRGMVRDAEGKLETAVDQETTEYWNGFIDSLKQLDKFLCLEAFKEETP